MRKILKTIGTEGREDRKCWKNRGITDQRKSDEQEKQKNEDEGQTGDKRKK